MQVRPVARLWEELGPRCHFLRKLYTSGLSKGPFCVIFKMNFSRSRGAQTAHTRRAFMELNLKGFARIIVVTATMFFLAVQALAGPIALVTPPEGQVNLWVIETTNTNGLTVRGPDGNIVASFAGDVVTQYAAFESRVDRIARIATFGLAFTNPLGDFDPIMQVASVSFEIVGDASVFGISKTAGIDVSGLRLNDTGFGSVGTENTAARVDVQDTASANRVEFAALLLGDVAARIVVSNVGVSFAGAGGGGNPGNGSGQGGTISTPGTVHLLAVALLCLALRIRAKERA